MAGVSSAMMTKEAMLQQMLDMQQKMLAMQEIIVRVNLRMILCQKFTWFFACDFFTGCLLYTSPSPRDRQKSRMPSSA